MKFIKPNEISGKILTLIEDGEQFVILVSPFVKISKWYKLTKKINAVKSRGVPIEFFIQKHIKNQESVDELEELDYKYTALPDIHCKLYLNEKYGIVTSMNLLLNSEINSIEIGYVTETKQEYVELLDYCKKYLMIDLEVYKSGKIASISPDWTESIRKTLSERLNRQIKANLEDSSLKINTGINNYKCFIGYSKTYSLRITRILSKEEFNNGQELIDYIEKESGFKIELYSGKGKYDATIWCTLFSDFKSQHLAELIEEEKTIVAERIINFITTIEKFKNRQQAVNKVLRNISQL